MKLKDSDWQKWHRVKTEIAQIQLKLRELMVLEAELAAKLVLQLQLHPLVPLSKRQMEVVNLLKTYPMFSNKELAGVLFVTERTVKFHISSILQRYGVRTRKELFLRCFKAVNKGERDAEVITYRAVNGPEHARTA